MLRVDLDGIVHRAAADYLERAVRHVEAGRCKALLVVIDTPGGALSATRSIATTFLNAEAPVVVYAHPSGARAGSAGTFIAAAAHIAAMAPGTNIGAEHLGSWVGQAATKVGREQLAQEVEQDTAAFARAIVEERGRNREWLAQAVLGSISATAPEALEHEVIDVVAPSIAQLLEAIDGREVQLDGRTVTLETARAYVVHLPPTIRERALTALAHPDVAYLLLMAGLLALLLEFQRPGTIVFGAAGAFCLVLAAVGFDMLPVHVGGLLLIVAGVALLGAELHIASFGRMTLGAAASLLLGSWLLIDRSAPALFADASVRVSWGLVMPTVSLFVGGTLFIAARMAKSSARKQRVRASRSDIENAIREARPKRPLGT